MGYFVCIFVIKRIIPNKSKGVQGFPPDQSEYTSPELLAQLLYTTQAYRAAATFGIRRALIVGLLAITAYYCGVVGLVQMLSGITHVS